GPGSGAGAIDSREGRRRRETGLEEGKEEQGRRGERRHPPPSHSSRPWFFGHQDPLTPWGEQQRCKGHRDPRQPQRDPILTLVPPLRCRQANASGWEPTLNASEETCSPPPPNSTRCPHGWDYSGLPVLRGNMVTQWDLVCERGWEVTLEQILFLLGFACGYLGLGHPTDRYVYAGQECIALGDHSKEQVS
uniref:Uncharacterized protein n=1 Tax=Sarcophilus harrisii TaxID=9305 RepID=A0A7N4NGP5_SARHA